MNRITIVAACMLACGLTLAGCNSSSISDFLPTGGGYPIRLETDPPGAEAQTSLGQTCRTPCTVAVPAARDDFTVTFALAGYEGQTVPVSVVTAAAMGSESPSPVQFAPNPVVAQLDPAPPPAANKKAAKPKAKARAQKAASGGGGTTRGAGATATPALTPAAAAQDAATAVPAATTGTSAFAPAFPAGVPAAQSPATQRTIPGAQPTAPPAGAWPTPR